MTKYFTQHSAVTNTRLPENRQSAHREKVAENMIQDFPEPLAVHQENNAASIVQCPAPDTEASAQARLLHNNAECWLGHVL